MEPILKINEPAVVGEIIDGEAVIMDLASGHYFSTRHVGCDIWRGVERGWSRSTIAQSLVALYEIDDAAADVAVEVFVSELLERNLVVEAIAAERPHHLASFAAPVATRRHDFAPPVLDAYVDMEELLLLDPIHDVDEAGWPMPKQSDAAD